MHASSIVALCHTCSISEAKRIAHNGPDLAAAQTRVAMIRLEWARRVPAL